ncbi:XRE family transcriptional regulator [Candidatus Dojkabacteria bacterium]|uniref:XRE family transcriptional regulator n=1 Tax=Candidatus Dojkabacteria bacterium TaxID=2099670 RepID=A0A5C7J2P5_9BACT|nr:MAG: XRE family transcriptional regulator [Candidatus Dojkabacteria bacterium]
MEPEDKKLANIEDFISPVPSGWQQEAEWRQNNRAWLDRSVDIAIQVLMSLRNKGKKQKWLAEQLGVSTQRVSKMVKGKENFTLQTISQLEEVLNIRLIEVITKNSQ